ncbi:MAG: SH3 domain-containing protein [Anaerolineae bacterium]|nr:SH3 domain-containing protein [Anaerolineae bacterium]
MSALLLAGMLVGVIGVSAQEDADALVASATVLRTKPATPAGAFMEDLLEGEAVSVLGQTRNGNWLYVETESGAKGWVDVGSLTVNVDLETADVVRDGEVELVYPPDPVATLLAGALLRDTAHDSVGADIETVPEGEQVAILGRSGAGNFIYVETVTGAKGWLKAASADINVDLDKLPVVRSGEVEIAMPAVSPTFTTTAETVVRDTAHDTVGEDIEALGEGRTGTILGRSRAGNFVYVEADSGAKGWVDSGAVQTDYPDSRVEIVQSGSVEIVVPPTPTATALVDAELVNNNREVIDTVPAGEATTALGRAGSQLIYVETASGAKGWLNAGDVELSVPADWLPRVAVTDATFVEAATPHFILEGEAALIDRPAATSMTVEDLMAGRTGTLLGQTANGNYYYVEMDSGAKGWLSVDAVTTAYPASRLPVVRSGEVEVVYPPEPTATLLNDAVLSDRASASVGVEIETVRAGETASILGRTSGGNFVYVETITGAKGWLPVSDVELNVEVDWLPVVRSGEVEVAMAALTPDFVVTGDAVVRDTAHDTVGADIETVFEGRTGTLLGVTRAGNFVYVEMDSSAKGWLRANAIETEYPIGRLEVMRSGDVEITSPVTPTATARDAQVQVYSRASTTAGVPIDFLNPGESATLLGRTRGGNFVFAETPSGARGFIQIGSVDLNVNPIVLPPVRDGEAETATGPMGTVVADGPVNLRSGPSTDFEIRAVVDPGTLLRLFGRDLTGAWLYVGLPSGMEGWMAGFLIDSPFDVMQLDIFTTP